MAVLEFEYLIINVLVSSLVMAAFFFWMIFSRNGVDLDDLKYTFTHDYPIAASLMVIILLISHFMTKGFLK